MFGRRKTSLKFYFVFYVMHVRMFFITCQTFSKIRTPTNCCCTIILPALSNDQWDGGSITDGYIQCTLFDRAVGMHLHYQEFVCALVALEIGYTVGEAMRAVPSYFATRTLKEAGSTAALNFLVHM